jgi:hypothetical protein
MNEARSGGHATPLFGKGKYFPGPKIVDCATSRRTTALSALGRATDLIHEYQSDLSSKSPLSSVSLFPSPEQKGSADQQLNGISNGLVLKRRRLEFFKAWGIYHPMRCKFRAGAGSCTPHAPSSSDESRRAIPRQVGLHQSLLPFHPAIMMRPYLLKKL